MQQRLIFNNLPFDPLKQNHFNRNFRVKKQIEFQNQFQTLAP